MTFEEQIKHGHEDITVVGVYDVEWAAIDHVATLGHFGVTDHDVFGMRVGSQDITITKVYKYDEEINEEIVYEPTKNEMVQFTEILAEILSVAINE